MVVERGNYRTGVRAELGAESVGVGLERENISIGTDDFIFVDGTFGEFGEEEFPDAGGAAGTHGMNATVPAVEISDHAHTRSTRGPNGEVTAGNAIDGFQMSAELVVGVI